MDEQKLLEVDKVMVKCPFAAPTIKMENEG
jgi:hypothetical protein